MDKVQRKGEGTYYPGRTKPLVGLSLTPLAKSLENNRSTFASPCGKKGEVYKIEMVGRPGKYRYALLNDRIEHYQCGDVGKHIMKTRPTVPLVDLSIGLAEYFGIKRAGVGQFQVTLAPVSEHAQLFRGKAHGDVAQKKVRK